jgi:hypothetical protein
MVAVMEASEWNHYEENGTYAETQNAMSCDNATLNLVLN